MQKLLFKVFHKFPRAFAKIGIKSLKPDIRDERDDVMGQEYPRFEWTILKEDGAWEKDYPLTDQETQQWMDCTGHGLKNILQMLYLVKWGEKISLSAAYINGMAGTGRYTGNSLRAVLESVRKNGWVTDEEWPEENRWKLIPQTVIDKGRARLKEYDFGYDSVLNSEKALNTACKYSPLYVGGSAWARNNEGLYYTFGTANHAFDILRNSIKRLAGDSYSPYIKRLAPNFQVVWPRRIYLGKKVAEWNQPEINKWIERGFKFIMRPEANGEVYKLTSNGLVHLAKENLRKELKEFIPDNDVIVWLANNKTLIGLPEEYYFRLKK